MTKPARSSLLCVFALFAGCQMKGALREAPAYSEIVESWVTRPDRSALFERRKESRAFRMDGSTRPSVVVDADKAFQSMDGFGFALTGGSAMLIRRMDPPARAALLKELFSCEGRGIGLSYLRISIGSSDLDERVFSYDDIPPGEADPDLARFSIEPDRANLIPVLKEILAVAPEVRIMASPWSAPAWMKDNGSSKGGRLKPGFYGAYAAYFVKYLQAMRSEGIPISAVTVQNEPLNGGNNPSMVMVSTEAARFIRENLGPAFKAAGIGAKIVAYDHNADRIDYPLDVFRDEGAAPFVDGAAFHLYGGSIEALSQVHAAFPGKNLYFTEQWYDSRGEFAGDLGWHAKNLIIGAPRNWCRAVVEWNLASDPRQNIHTEGGCDRCLGALTIDRNEVRRNAGYYVVAHASKFVRPGSVRIDSSAPEGLDTVAFLAPGGSMVLIVLNGSSDRRTFDIRYKGRSAAAELEAGSVGTFVWRPSRPL